MSLSLIYKMCLLIGPREQLNQVTPYIDGSVVYGGNAELMSELRTFTDGLLVSSHSPDGRELLPVDRQPKDGCNQAAEAAKGRYCFKSGDARANENLHLTTLHLIFSRQHNRLAAILKQKNPTWSDEMLFQESRKIVAAQLQHVHYNEFLPTVLGENENDVKNGKKQSNFLKNFQGVIWLINWNSRLKVAAITTVTTRLSIHKLQMNLRQTLSDLDTRSCRYIFCKIIFFSQQLLIKLGVIKFKIITNLTFEGRRYVHKLRQCFKFGRCNKKFLAFWK